MALVDNAWYTNYGDGATTGYYALTKWTNHTAVAGEIIRQFTAPAVGSERVFVCTTAGATGAVEPTWVNTRGALNTSSSAVYQECTGIAALNGDDTNTPSWTITATPPGGVKNTVVTLGQVIKRDNGASYQICTIAGTAGNGAEPAFSNTAGVTTADNTVTWTSLGVVGNWTVWKAPHARLNNAGAWGQAGNTFFVSAIHAETQSTSNTVTMPGTTAVPTTIVCVAQVPGAAPPGSADVTTGASVTTTGNSNITINGSSYWRGVAFNFGTGGNATNIAPCSNNMNKYENCAFAKVATSAQGAAVSVANKLILINTTMSFGNTGDGLKATSGATIDWRNTASAIVGATIPNSLFAVATGSSGMFLATGVDFSAITVGPIINNQNGATPYLLRRCKIAGSVAVANTPFTRTEGNRNIITCDSAATNYLDSLFAYEWTQSVETTIVRTGGATDGTTLISWKLVSTANSIWTMPFESQLISIWNDSISAITTLTIYGTTTGGGVPKDDEIWVEVEYLGSGSTPQASFKTSTKADNLAASAATNNSSDVSTWAGGGAGNGFKIVVSTFTPGMKGPINITVKVAKASTTYYIDPKPVVV